jgi:hypothetical protein
VSIAILAERIREMRTFVLATTMSVALMGGASAGFQGNAAPPPRCVIADPDPPTNVRTRANGVIIRTLSNGDRVRVIDQIRANDGLWDFVMEVNATTDQEQPLGWVFDQLVRCH